MAQNKSLAGSIPKALVSLAFPLLLGNILQQLYHAADSLIIGRFLGTEAFAAVGVAGTVMNLFLFVIAGFCSGLAALFARFYGAEDLPSFRRELFSALWLGGGSSALLALLSLPLIRPLLELIRTPDNLLAPAEEYLTVVVLGIPACFLYNLFSAVLQSAGNTRAALLFLAVSVLINTAGDFFLVVVLPLGVAGGALSTVLAQLFSDAGCLCYLRARHRALLCGRGDTGFHRELLAEALRFGLSSALHQSSLYIGKLLVQGAVNTLGTAGAAAYTAAARVEGFANSFGDSGAHALSVFTAQNLGAQKVSRVREGLRQGMLLHLLLGAALSVSMFFTAEPGVKVFLAGENGLSLSCGVSYLKTVSIFYLFCFIGSAFVGYYRGTGRVQIPVIGTALHIGIRVLLSFLLIRRMGLSAVGIATGAGWCCVVLFQSLCLFRLRRVQGQK